MPVTPTKGNLIATKKMLKLAETGYELLDKKRSVLIREMMALIEKASEIQSKIDSTFAAAYMALQKANITVGICSDLAELVPEEDSIELRYRSVMGVEIPSVTMKTDYRNEIPFGFDMSNSLVDEAMMRFDEVKWLASEIAEAENSVYRLAYEIKKTQKRANSLQNIVIPQYRATVKHISDVLEEKDREEFSRMKVIKAQKTRKTREKTDEN